MTKTSRIVVTVAALAGVPVAVLVFLSYLDLPPAPWVQLPSNAYDETRLAHDQELLSLLALKYKEDASGQCKTDIVKVMGKDPSPEDLALVAIWAERSDPWLNSRNPVYTNLFFGNVSALAETRNDARARYALWKIRESLVAKHRWDGRLAEAIESAERKQRGEL